MLVHDRHARIQHARVHHRVQHDRVQHEDRIHEMVNDTFGIGDGMEPEQNLEEDPIKEARGFYKQLEEASHPLCEGSLDSTLTVAVRLLSIKSDWKVSQDAMDSMISLLGELENPELNIPQIFYQAKKLVSKLGLSYNRIHMLFNKNDVELENCKFYEHARYKWTPGGKMISIKVLHYLPLIPRLKRLYALMSSAPHIKWHYENRRPSGVLSHPLDREAWKYFDRTYPDFASESRNVRLGLCAYDFTPFSNSGTPYSCWPVFITSYNLLPEMCMTSPDIFLSCIIPGPRNPKCLIDVYLQPLIDELLQLWHEGVVTYDISTKQNFIMRTNLMWTINDFLGYEILSG
ncbi:uncharacterized protein LOC124900097 [Capsicum annuum]|uniref:uncharacterized protein LOC124900097 n=1 Tax=Capsicum annuum TaxID=4072 RepID=UPI001FB084AC|nr:uncharacterized protein LOC124900097 [Capsicum annuum]